MKLQLENLPVYVAHVKKGFEPREVHVIETMKNLDMKFNWVLDGDIPDLNQSLLEKYMMGDLLKINAGTSCTMKHLFMVMQMLDNNNEMALLLEDDFIVTDNFNTVLSEVLDDIQYLKPGFFISLENTGFKSIKYHALQTGKHLFAAEKTRCAAAYLIDRIAAENILNYTLEHKCNQIIDWHYNTIAAKGLMQIFWCNPAIVEQGSHNGKFSSALSNRKSNLIRRISYSIQKMMKK